MKFLKVKTNENISESIIEVLIIIFIGVCLIELVDIFNIISIHKKEETAVLVTLIIAIMKLLLEFLREISK